VWIESIPFYEYQIWIDKLNDAIEIENAEAQAASGLKEVFSLGR
jgi:hypothetical protein